MLSEADFDRYLNEPRLFFPVPIWSVTCCLVITLRSQGGKRSWQVIFTFEKRRDVLQLRNHVGRVSAFLFQNSEVFVELFAGVRRVQLLQFGVDDVPSFRESSMEFSRFSAVRDYKQCLLNTNNHWNAFRPWNLSDVRLVGRARLTKFWSHLRYNPLWVFFRR